MPEPAPYEALSRMIVDAFQSGYSQGQSDALGSAGNRVFLRTAEYCDALTDRLNEVLATHGKGKEGEDV